MPLFPQLHIDCPACHACKIKNMHSPGGATKSKTSSEINRNLVQIAQPIASRTRAKVKPSLTQCHPKKIKESHNTKYFNQVKSLLLSRMKIRVPLKAYESFFLPGSLVYADFVFYPIESVRGHTPVLDIT